MSGAGGEEARPSTAAVAAAFAAVYLIWGSTYLAIRFAIETLPPMLMAGARFLVAGGILYAWARSRGAGRPAGRHWRAATVVGGLLLLGGNGGVVWAQQWVPSGLAALLVATVPLWMVLFDWVRPAGSRPGRSVVLGLVVGFGGVAVLVGPAGGLGAGVPWLPAAVLLFAAGSWAAGSLYSRVAPLPRAPSLATAMEMLGGGALLLLAGLARGEAGSFAPEAVSLRSLLGLGYLVLFGSIVAFSAYIWLLRVSTPARVSTYAYVNPIVAVLLGWALAAEPLTPRIGVAASLVVAAVFLVTVGRQAGGAGAEARPPSAAGAVRPAAASGEGAPPLGGAAAARDPSPGEAPAVAACRHR